VRKLAGILRERTDGLEEGKTKKLKKELQTIQKDYLARKRKHGRRSGYAGGGTVIPRRTRARRSCG